MSIRNISFAKGEYYHLYNRGNSKQKIFLDKKDHEHFLKLLFLCNSERSFVFRDITKDVFIFDRETTLVNIGAYCLMPNHFHLLVQEKTEDGISKFMQKLSTAYVMYFNAKYNRTGGLFEGKFKSKHISTDQHMKYLFSYIHLNPVKLVEPKWKERKIINLTKTKLFLRNYLYSSYSEYLGKNRQESVILTRKSFPKYFPSKKDFESEIIEWLDFNS